MHKGKWTNVADGMEFRSRSGRLKVTTSVADGNLYNLLEYQKGVGYVWQDRYTKRALNKWLSDNGYPKL